MNYLTIPMFRALLKKKEAIITLAFGFFPLLLIIVDMFNTNFLQFSAPKNSLSFMEFWGAIVSTQYQMSLPIIAFFYLVVTVFHDEIKSGIMFLYKDLNRRTILNGKLSALILFYMLYMIIVFISSIITYYFHLIHLSYASGQFIPSNDADLSYVIIEIVGISLVSILCLLLCSTMSINFSNGVTMISSIVFALISFIAPHLKLLAYIFPNGYISMLSKSGLVNTFVYMFVIFIIYILIFYCLAYRSFNRLEY